MSRIGKKPINLHADLLLTLQPEKIIIKGKYGTAEQEINNLLKIRIENNNLFITRVEESCKAREYHGLIRALIQNKINGILKKFTKILIIEGVGYKFQLEKKNLSIFAGFTHPVFLEIPLDLDIKLESPSKIVIAGICKEKVGLFAAKIRAIKPPEPYKGKGIIYEGEIIKRKVGKTGK